MFQAKFHQLENPENHITSGFWWDGRYWASIKDCGLLDLTSCARGWRTLDGVPRSIEEAMDALRAMNQAMGRDAVNSKSNQYNSNKLHATTLWQTTHIDDIYL